MKKSPSPRGCRGKHVLIYILALLPVTVFAQDYKAYQRYFNRVDEDILTSDWATACLRLDSVNRAYDFVYARHCIKALQICVLAADSLRMDTWLNRCFTRGVPLWCIRNNRLLQRSMHYANTRLTIARYDSLHRVYEFSVNRGLAATLDSLLRRDQRLTNRVNDGFILFRPFYGIRWLQNNKRQYRLLKDIIRRYGYPGERLVGLPGWQLDSAVNCKEIIFWGPELNDTRVRTMLLHCFSSPRDDLNDLLLPAVEQGYLPAGQYGAFNDFLATWGKRRYRGKTYYNVWHHDPDSLDLPGINQRRGSLGLNRFDQQERNRLINRERRKNGIMDSCVLLE